MSEIELPRSWWHGCWLEPGHYLFDRRGRRARDEECPVTAHHESWWLDGQLAPRRLRAGWSPPVMPLEPGAIVYGRMAGEDRDLRHRIEAASCEAEQGEFLLHPIAGCTIASWWDRTQGDTRGACNSCLIVEGVHSANEMLELFPRLFPRQAERLASAGVSLRFLRWAT